MNCEQALEAISAKLDGELDEAGVRELDAHLAGCPECRRIFEELKSIDDSMQDLSDNVPEELRTRVMAQVEKEPRTGKRQPKWLAGALAAAAVAALILLSALGVLEAPGFGRGTRSSASFHSAVSVESRVQGFGSGEASLPEEYAGLADRYGAQVLAIWSPQESFPALDGAAAEPLGAGTLYTVAPEVLSQMMQTYAESTSVEMQLYFPSGEASQTTAYVLLIPAKF